MPPAKRGRRTKVSDCDRAPRVRPNIAITGTPGVGKTLLAQKVAETLKMTLVDVGGMIKTDKLYEEWDDEMNC